MPANPATTSWLIRPRPNPRASLQLFCLPFAGAGASLFRLWPEGLPPSVELCAVQLPGREGRMREPAHQRIGPLIAELMEALPPELDRPFAIFGHSFGALVAFELARVLRREGLSKPKILIVSGRVAPQLPLRRRPIHALPDAEFRDELRRLDGTPKAVLDHQELMNLYTPIIRADLAVNESYGYRDEPPLEIPLLALGGLDDPLVNHDDLAAWSVQTRDRFEYRTFPGGHFFLQSSTPEFLATLTRTLVPLQETP